MLKDCEVCAIQQNELCSLYAERQVSPLVERVNTIVLRVNYKGWDIDLF